MKKKKFDPKLKAWLETKSIEWVMFYENCFILFTTFASETHFKFGYKTTSYYSKRTQEIRATYIDTFLNIITE